jgi:hypothetical protein
MTAIMYFAKNCGEASFRACSSRVSSNEEDRKYSDNFSEGYVSRSTRRYLLHLAVFEIWISHGGH